MRRDLILVLGFVSSAAFAQSSITVPSNQEIELYETLNETDAKVLRLRFVAPDLASPMKRPSFDALSEDFQVLCDTFGLAQAQKLDVSPDQIVISLSAKPVEFGIAQTEVEQIFEAFSVQNETCMLEMF